MKHCSRTLISVCVVCLCSFLSAYARTHENVNGEKMHKIVKSMLGFKGEIPDRPNVGGDAPKYMLDLYERFKNGPISKGQQNGNTVRSIQAKTKSVNGRTMFVFNLTSLASTEQMISAEIHLYKRRKTRFNKKADLDIVLHELAPQSSSEIGKITIKPESFGWQWFDVSSNVLSCVYEHRDIPNSLGLNFKLMKPNGLSDDVKINRFMHHHSTPYLIIYSNDSQDLDIEELDQMTESYKKQQNILSEAEDVVKSKLDVLLPVRTKREKRSLDDNSADLPVYQSRARSMSILTNEIPEDPDDFRSYPNGVNVPTHPGMLQTRKESRHRLGDSRLIPYPGDYVDSRKKKWRNRRKKNKKGRRKNTLELPKEWEDLRNMAEDNNSGYLCGKRKLTVDFNDIGWGEWIISPKSFKAHYCAGSCPFPLTKKLRPSNHATIQSLVNAVGINPEVPAPCCVPDKLSSITLLYFDENRNVVLKNYPNMTVQKCACR